MASAVGTGVDVSATARRSELADARQTIKTIKVRALAVKPTSFISFGGVEDPFAPLRAGSARFLQSAEKLFPRFRKMDCFSHPPLTLAITGRAWIRPTRWPSFLGPGTDHSRQCQNDQQNPLQTQLASGGIKPFLQRVGAAAPSPGAECNGFAAQGYRDISIGGGALSLRGIA